MHWILSNLGLSATIAVATSHAMLPLSRAAVLGNLLEEGAFGCDLVLDAQTMPFAEPDESVAAGIRVTYRVESPTWHEAKGPARAEFKMPA